MSADVPDAQVCPDCGATVPRFPQLTCGQIQALERLAREEPMQATRRLRELTSCDVEEAKCWVMHAKKPPPARCPGCGERLRSPGAKQCLACGRDWH